MHMADYARRFESNLSGQLGALQQKLNNQHCKRSQLDAPYVNEVDFCNLILYRVNPCIQSP